MASESPLETLAAVTDHVIDIMKYAFEDSYSEIPASQVARSHVDYSDVIDYVEDEVNDVPDLIDENGNVIYAVYLPSGYTTAEICADVRAAGPPAYGRWLDLTSDPSQLITC